MREGTIGKASSYNSMADSNNVVGLFSLALGLLATGLGTMVLLFMSGLRKDIHDLVIRMDKQQEQITEVRVGMAKMQEQMYTMLRGGPPMTPISSQGGT